MSKKTFLEDMVDHLQSCGVGTQGADLFYGTFPDTPDAAVCVNEYAGGVPEYVLEGVAYNNPGLQAVARAANYATARTKMGEVVRAMTGKSFILNDTRYGLIGPRQNPFPLGPDAKGRPVLACNFDVFSE